MKLLKMLLLSIFLVGSTVKCEVSDEQRASVALAFGSIVWCTGLYFTAKRAYEIYKALEKYARKEEINFREIPLFLVKLGLSIGAMHWADAVFGKAARELKLL